MVDDSLPHRTACGFVLVRRKAARLEYLLLRNRSRKDWGLPKGHAKGGESELATARRETTEETGLQDLEVLHRFRIELLYTVTRRSRRYRKTVIYFAARTRSAEVVLSKEHDKFRWAPLADVLEVMPFHNLREAVRRAALFLKDPALFDLEPATEADALAHLTSLPHADKRLVKHLRGGARLARTFAEALAGAGKPIHIEATAAGTLLHDVGRALGQHDDHPRAGAAHLHNTVLAPYGFACISHFTKGASPKRLVKAGVAKSLVKEFARLVDMSRMTWEERCCALADACMKGTQAVPPAERFEDLRARYDSHDLIALQERRTQAIRRKLARTIGQDPLDLVGLA